MWIDEGKNYYDENKQYTFSQIATLYNINETYVIHHNYMEGGNLINPQTEYKVKEGTSVFGSVEHPHATFESWYFDAEYTQPAVAIESGTFGDITLYAKMNPNTYQITYENIENASYTENMLSEYTYGLEYELPILTRACYVFKGWFLDEAYTQELPCITRTTGGNLTLYAKWEENHDTSIVKNVVEATCTVEGYSGDKHCKVCDELVEPGEVLNKTAHKVAKKNEAAATCYSTGYTGDEYCEICETELLKGTEIPMLGHNIDRENGVILKAATETAVGMIQYPCKNCTYTITEEIPKLEVTEEDIMNAKDDGDIKGSTFILLQARGGKTTNHSIQLKWTKVKDADGYIIYSNKCGKKNRYNKIKTISKGNTTSYTHKKLNGKKLKKGTYYKYIVRAYKEVGGEKVTIAASKTIHITTNGGKYGVAKAVKVKTDSKLKQKKKTYTLSLKQNKKYTIKASELKQSKSIRKHRAIAFESSDTNVATVSKKGVVKGKGKGTCYIYVYAQNGVFQKIKVKIK